MARVVFMGTPEFSVPVLRALIDQHEVIGVVTQPDRPAGRGREPQSPPVKRIALEHNIPVQQPDKLRRPEAVEALRAWSAEFFVVAAFGQILPQSVLDMPTLGPINVHASLLPRWRGAAPIQASLLAGDAQTGVTIMRMEAGLDTGPMLLAEAIEIASDETAATLHDKLAALGAKLILPALEGVAARTLHDRPQPEEGVTWAPQIKKEQGQLDFTRSAVELDRQVRAFTPWPGTFCTWDGQILKILQGRTVEGRLPAGQVEVQDSQLAIGTSDGIYIPQLLQLAGRKPVTAEAFLRGYPKFVGAKLS